MPGSRAPRRGDESALVEAHGDVARPGRAARGLRRRSRRSCSASATASGSPTCGCACASSSSDGQITAAKTALGYLPKDEAPDERMLAEAARQPKRLLDRLPRSLDKRATQARSWCSRALRQARNDPEAVGASARRRACDGAARRGCALPVGTRRARRRARVHHENALEWFARADDARLDDQQLAWKARAALRAGAWQTVREAIDRMSPEQRHEAAWTYWYGRALAAQGEDTGSRAYYLRIAGQTDFYGLLANEELGYVGTVAGAGYVPDRCTTSPKRAANAGPRARARADPPRACAPKACASGSSPSAISTTQQLLAAAELARREGVYDRAIHTADRTVRTHNFALRYPAAVPRGVQRVRQDLRPRRSLGPRPGAPGKPLHHRCALGAGAAGLMQVMPRTATLRRAASIGLRNYRPKDVTEIETNVTLGAGYMRMVLDQLGHQVLASAAYNAGPSRARRWRDANAARRRDLRRDDSLRRDARLREEGDGELGVLLRGADQVRRRRSRRASAPSPARAAGRTARGRRPGGAQAEATPMKLDNVLVLGGSGFIGRHLVAALAAPWHQRDGAVAAARARQAPASCCRRSTWSRPTSWRPARSSACARGKQAVDQPGRHPARGFRARRTPSCPAGVVAACRAARRRAALAHERAGRLAERPVRISAHQGAWASRPRSPPPTSPSPRSAPR